MDYIEKEHFPHIGLLIKCRNGNHKVLLVYCTSLAHPNGMCARLNKSPLALFLEGVGQGKLQNKQNQDLFQNSRIQLFPNIVVIIILKGFIQKYSNKRTII